MKHTKKLLSLVLALLFVTVSLGAVAESAPLPDIDTTDFVPYEEPIKITVLQLDKSTNDRNSSIPGRASLQDNSWIDAYEKYLNIKVDRIIAEDATALNSLLNTMMASDELPDVFIATQEMYYTMIENEVLADLEAAFNEACATLPYFKKIVDTHTEYTVNHFRYNGQMLGFPVLCAGGIADDVLWIRQDWLDALNLQAPKTIDELVTVARAFKDAAFGGADTYGLGLYDDQTGSNILRDFINGYGVVSGTWTKQENGDYVYADVQSEKVAPALLKLQEMFKDGLLKADFAVSKTLDDEVATGKCGMVYGPTWYGATAISANYVNDEKAEWIAVQLPSVTGEVLPCKGTTASFQEVIMVSEKCEHPEAIFKMMNLEAFVHSYDSEKILSSELNVCDDGYEMWDLKVFRNLGPATVAIEQYEMARDYLHQIKEGTLKLEDIKFEDGVVELLTNAGVKAMNGDRTQMGLNSVIEYGNLVANELFYMGDKIVLPYDGPITENISLYRETIDAELIGAMCSVVMGEDISVYENAVKTWYNQGGQAITEDVNEYYKSIE